MTDKLPAAARRFRWYQIRLWFLILVIPLGGLALGLSWVELQEYGRDAEFLLELSAWRPNALEEERDSRFIKKMIERQVPIGALSRDLLNASYLKDDLLQLLVVDTNVGTYQTNYLFRLSNDRRLIGVIALHKEWKWGRAPDVSAEVLAGRKFLLNVDMDITYPEAKRLLRDHGFSPGVPEGRFFKHIIHAALGPDFVLDGWSEQNPTVWYWTILPTGQKWKNLRRWVVNPEEEDYEMFEGISNQ